MKRWMLFGIALCVLLAGTFAALIGFFFSDIFTAFSANTPSQPVINPFASQATTESTLFPPTEATTVPETTVETVPETTEATTVPETQPETIPETTAPTQPVETQPKPQPETQPPTQPPTQPSVSNLSANYGFVYDLTADTYLHTFGDQNQSISIASVTKLYTAYVALQHMDLQTVITAGEEIRLIDKDSSRAYIYEGQKVTVEMLVRGMIIPSGNDAAYILAVATGRKLLGNSDADVRAALNAFVDEMNNQAANLGLTGSHFANPDGIDDANHYSTCADVLTIAKLALNNPTIRQCAATAKITQTYVSGDVATWVNSNRLLHPSYTDYYCPQAFGLKTGHTSNAGWCLVSAFDCGDRTLLIGVFGSDTINQRDTDTLSLYEKFS